MTALNLSSRNTVVALRKRIMQELGNPLILFSKIWLSLVVIAVLGGDLVAPHSSIDANLTAMLLKPFTSLDGNLYILGTDSLGRDYLSRLIVGARFSCTVGLAAALLGTLIGLIAGSLAGYLGGKVDTLISRLIDLQQAFPSLLFALLVLVSVGPSFGAVLVVLAIGSWASMGRFVRGLTLEIKQLPFIDGARILGASRVQILLRHVLPNLTTEVAILCTLRVANLMLLSAGLDFLGLGLQPPQTSWGLLIAEGRSQIDSAWWITAFPGIAIFLTALSINLIALRIRSSMDAESAAMLLAKKDPDTKNSLLAKWKRSKADSSARVKYRDEAADTEHLLSIKNLSVDFYTQNGLGKAVRDVSWFVNSGEVLAIVGESGSGKSVSMQAIMKTLPPVVSKYKSDAVILSGKELSSLSPKQRRSYAGSKLAVIPQDALAALDPSMTISAQMCEAIRMFSPKISQKDAKKSAIDMLTAVGIPDAENRILDYPHQFSGGMCQRVLIAMALVRNPMILIADEPTTALDVTVQKQIMELLMKVRSERQMSVVLISHDLALVSQYADRVIVMYAGKIMEAGDVDQIIHHPSHPYTKALLLATPEIENSAKKLVPIQGIPPIATKMPKGCAFSPRCSVATAECANEEPALIRLGKAHESACHLLEGAEHGN